MQTTVGELLEMRGCAVYAADGEKVGKMEDVFVDLETEEPEWIGVATGIFGTKNVPVPLDGASIREDALVVAYPKAKIDDAPDVEADEIPPEEEAQLYAHYELREPGPMTGISADREATVVRAEEELAVGKRPADAGRVRIRKWVEKEPVTVDVELEHEKAVVSREPASGRASEPLGEDAIEVPLRSEEAVVEKRPVARERISVDKQTETERETISDDVRKERVEVEGDEPRS